MRDFRKILDVLKNEKLSQVLSLVLTFLAIAAGIATYVVFSNTPPGEKSSRIIPLVYVDIILLLLLAVVIVKRFVELSHQRRRNIAGSKLQGQILLLLGFVSVTPAIFVSIFAAFFFNISIESWFGNPVSDALDQASQVANAYMSEHKKSIANNAQAIVLSLRPYVPNLIENSDTFNQALDDQADIHTLGEVLVFNGSGSVVGRSRLTFSLEFEKVSGEHFRRARDGELVILSNDDGDRVRALLQLDPITDTYLYIGKFVDRKVLSHVSQSKGAVSEYKRLEAEKGGLQITFILFFFLITLLLLLSSVWLGMVLSNILVDPIRRLIAAAGEISAGNLSVVVKDDPLSNNEINVLSRAFNHMVKQIEKQQKALVSANDQIDRRRQIIETIISKITAGVMGLNEKEEIYLINERACTLMSADLNKALKKPLIDISYELHDLIHEASLQRSVYEPINRQLTIARNGMKRIIQVCVVTETVRQKISGYIVTFDDVTDLVAAQRKAAWSDVARKIAHEIKNPLTPIQLSAERLKRRYASQISSDLETFQNCIDVIIRQVNHIGKLVSEFSSFARMPEAVLKEQVINPVIDQIIALQASAQSDIKFDISKPDKTILWEFDAEQISQVLTNLILNAVNALKENNISNPQICISYGLHSDSSFFIAVEDNGPGFPDVDRLTLLDPYVTLRSKGTGLGLAIVAKIVQDHRGDLDLSNSTLLGGAKVFITLNS